VPETEKERIAAILRPFPFRIDVERALQREIYSDEEWNVLRVTVHDTMHVKGVVRRLAKHFPYFVFFNSDIMPQQLYLYHTGLFPLAYGEYAVGRTGGSPAGTAGKRG